MELLVDNQIVGAPAAFEPFGEVRLFAGRELKRAALGAAEVLLVRSVTRVDRALLGGSRVRFVATATAGTDHVDLDYLTERGIGFAAAPGCNARAVAEHVACCLYAHAARSGRRLQELEVGIVGYGNVGRALAGLLRDIDVRFVVNDPPLGEHIEGVETRTLDALLDCDVVTLHVPLTAVTDHPTVDLVDRRRVAALKPGALLINAARGGVVDEAALAERLAGGPPLTIALDCWADEPRVHPASLAAAWLATPHIAGHSIEARHNATRQLLDALARFLGTGPVTAPAPPPSTRCPAGPGDGIAEILGRVHALVRHTERMRELVSLDDAARGARFDEIRRQHGLRREFARTAVACAGLAPDTVVGLERLGFDLV
ncbi:MAG: 4-phosphoerythronate dehydrogenase [Gammaproteobacteria bacterium]